MAATTTRDTLTAAGYRNGQAQHVGRCAKCRHAAPGRKQHGRTCTKLQVAVLTHGICKHYASALQVPVPRAGSDAIEIAVRFTAGAHVTNTIRGKRASSTCSGEEAARSLCRKLYENESVTLLLTQVEPGRQVFTVIREQR